MGSIIIKNLRGKEELKIIGTTRSECREVAGYSESDSTQMIPYRERYQYMKTADVIVSVTSSPHYTFTMEEVAQELKGEKLRKLFIDLAVPCDIDKGILELEGLELIDIDYFEQASRENNRLKVQELSKAEEILEVCVDETLKEIYFRKFYGSLEQLTNRVNEHGIQPVLYRLKEGLDSQQFKAVLDLLVEEI